MILRATISYTRPLYTQRWNHIPGCWVDGGSIRHDCPECLRAVDTLADLGVPVIRR